MHATNYIIFQKIPSSSVFSNQTTFQRLQRSLTNDYRGALYAFLQRFIYRGEMIFGVSYFSSGLRCGLSARIPQKYAGSFFPIFGLDLTTSEDIFFGFAFAEMGYRNINVEGFIPSRWSLDFQALPSNFKWSSSFYNVIILMIYF